MLRHEIRLAAEREKSEVNKQDLVPSTRRNRHAPGFGVGTLPERLDPCRHDCNSPRLALLLVKSGAVVEDRITSPGSCLPRKKSRTPDFQRE
jgi:hypothetical protein